MIKPLNQTLSKSIINTLSYYDIFNYPLKCEEVYRFLGTNHVNENDVKEKLIGLSKDGIVFQYGDFFTLQNSETPVLRRIKGNEEAARCLKFAKHKAKFIMNFPFVRAVMASGSLSKGYMDEHSDLDFFVVTKPKRLWIARSLLVFYRKVFLFNSYKNFCVNYFVDSEHLEIEEQNIFTATELATAIPLEGAEYYTALHKANSWVVTLLPNFRQQSITDVPLSRVNGLKGFIERLLNILHADGLNRILMKLTLNRWKALYKKFYSDADFNVAFKTKEYASKGHPKHYQKKVLDLHSEKYKKIESRLPV
jgi:hypothetical protein